MSGASRSPRRHRADEAERSAWGREVRRVKKATPAIRVIPVNRVLKVRKVTPVRLL